METERAFARTAVQEGIRDSFLEYFADDALALTPEPQSAKDRLRSSSARPFSELELTGEPRTGDASAAGDLGWLTGPSTFVDHTASPPHVQHGNYLSIWRRQPDSQWRVFIDVGCQVPEPAEFGDGFTGLGRRIAGLEGAILAWIAGNQPPSGTTSAETTTAASAEAGDPGYSYGLCDVRGEPHERGAYVRVWARDAAAAGGSWRR